MLSSSPLAITKYKVMHPSISPTVAVMVLEPCGHAAPRVLSYMYHTAVYVYQLRGI